MARPTLYEICRVLHSETIYDQHEPIAGVATDSREVKPGELFVALKGQKVDGHDFVQQAYERGAIAALVSLTYDKKDIKLPLIRVGDPLDALQQLAKWHVARSKPTVIAITGSLGKTTTKEFLYALLKSKYKTASTSGNQNSQVGMAASLLSNVEGDEEFLVVEMGMTEKGHIKKLVGCVAPHMAIMTQIALVHAQNFASIEAIAEAKAEIFSSPTTRLVLINKDSPASDLLCRLAPCDTLTYSMHDPRANFYLDINDGAIRFFQNGLAKAMPYVDLPAPHVYLNALGACSMAAMCGMSTDEIGKAITTLKLPQMRLERVEKRGICFINDSYNAAEASLKAALSYMRVQDPSRRKIAVIGQMRELGRFSEGCHQAVGEHALECVDKVFCFGEECAPIASVWKKANRPVSWFLDFSELVATLREELKEDDLVLLKGSRSNGLWRVIEQL